MEFREVRGLRASDLFAETQFKRTQLQNTLSKTFLETAPPSGLSALRSTVQTLSVEFPSNAEICGTSSSSGRPCRPASDPGPRPLRRSRATCFRAHSSDSLPLFLSLSLHPPPPQHNHYVPTETYVLSFFSL